MVKRVSTDEKLEKIIAFFKKTPEIYTIKDLEKKIPKECGISGMLVPDLIKRLCDENMLSMEKCGASNLYWCFPYQKHHALSCDVEKMALAIESFKEEKEKKTAQLEKLKEMKENNPERDALIAEYKKLKKKVLVIEEHRKQCEECSIEEYKNFVKEIKEMKGTVNKTTDDIYALQGYVCFKYGLTRKEFNQNFELDDAMDYLSLDK
ncbi:Meiotic nuclear division protein 1 [Glugoides intestinalis]